MVDSAFVQDAGQDAARLSEFEAAVVSAVGEAFNNVAIHGHTQAESGLVDFEIDAADGAIRIRMIDRGRSFEFPENPDRPRELSESGMGLYIIKSFMDEVKYTPRGNAAETNVLWMSKRAPSR